MVIRLTERMTVITENGHVSRIGTLALGVSDFAMALLHYP